MQKNDAVIAVANAVRGSRESYVVINASNTSMNASDCALIASDIVAFVSHLSGLLALCSS